MFLTIKSRKQRTLYISLTTIIRKFLWQCGNEKQKNFKRNIKWAHHINSSLQNFATNCKHHHHISWLILCILNLWISNEYHKRLMLTHWQRKTVLRCHQITNHCFNYFKIIILKVNKLTIHGELWLDDCVKLFTLPVYTPFSHIINDIIQAE